MKKLKIFIKESFLELKKVVWPARSKVADSTKIVLISTSIFALVLGVADFIILAGIDFFLG